MPIPFVAFHDASSVQYQQKVATLAQQGYRPISVSVYGPPSDAHYAGVWVKRGGSAFIAGHGMTGQEYQDWFNKNVAKGYAPTMVSATGAGDKAVFAAVMEKGTTGSFARIGLSYGPEYDPNSFQGQCRIALNNGYVLRSASTYGDPTHPLFAGTWTKTAQPVRWKWNLSPTYVTYQTVFDAYTKLPFRPAFVTSSSNQVYLSTFCDDSVGAWVARHNMTSAEYQSEFNKWTAQGLMPISVQGGGAGNATRFAAIFAQQDQPQERQWTVTGSAVSGTTAYDNAVKTYMQQKGIRAGTLAISKNGVIKYARAFTWAEPGYPITQPGSLFRLASVSKMFTCAAIQKLYDAKKLTPDTKIFPLLGITKPALLSQTPDARINNIMIQNLVDHLGGWQRGVPYEPIVKMRDWALEMGLLPGPMKKYDFARYMYGQPLQFTPGAMQPAGVDTYSNFGYTLLGMAIEKVTGQTYADYVKQAVLAPLGITDVYQARTLRSQKFPNEVTYDDSGLGLSAVNIYSNLLEPAAYGGQGFLTEVMDSGGGLAATASAVAQLAHSYPTWGIGNKRGSGGRMGGLWGTSSWVFSRDKDGVDFAFIFNTWDDSVVNGLNKDINKLLDTVPIP